MPSYRLSPTDHFSLPVKPGSQLALTRTFIERTFSYSEFSFQEFLLEYQEAFNGESLRQAEVVRVLSQDGPVCSPLDRHGAYTRLGYLCDRRILYKIKLRTTAEIAEEIIEQRRAQRAAEVLSALGPTEIARLEARFTELTSLEVQPIEVSIEIREIEKKLKRGMYSL